MTVRTRLTLWYSALLALLVFGFAVASYAYLKQLELDRIDSTLHEQSEIVTKAMLSVAPLRGGVDSMGTPSVLGAIHDLRARGIRAWVFDERGTLVLSTAQVREDEGPEEEHEVLGDTLSSALLRQIAERRTPGTFVVPAGEHGARLTASSLPGALGNGMLLVSYPLADLARLLARARSDAAIAILVSLVVSLFVGYTLARNSMAPIAAMSARAELIGATNLHERIPVHNARDELGGLATTFNGLLDRVANTLDQQRRFMADASHELRTPVAIMRGEADVVLGSEDRSPQGYREALVVVRDAAERLSHTVNDIFLLARVDAKQVPATPAPVYLGDLVADASRAMRSIAERRGITIDCVTSVDASYVGDEQLLQRLVTNLIDNAIKYSADGGIVCVRFDRTASAFELAISNGGLGIPPEARTHVFERFFRVDAARAVATNTLSGSGSGLGLAIARWIAELHAGTLELTEATNTRTTFTLRLPLEPALSLAR
ncbi:MAG TPA: ATP-binding protein [Gemmatimonadaceae bacterium]